MPDEERPRPIGRQAQCANCGIMFSVASPNSTICHTLHGQSRKPCLKYLHDQTCYEQHLRKEGERSD